MEEKSILHNLQKVFDAINNRQMEYNWIITDCECFPESSEINNLFFQEYCFLSGDELTEIIKQEDFQWIWALLSGFKKDIPYDEIMKYPLPYANGYEGFWKNPFINEDNIKIEKDFMKQTFLDAVTNAVVL